MQSKNQSIAKDSQLVFITDEMGIFEAFEELKSQLPRLTVQYITLIYAVSQRDNNHFPFLQELKILEKRFSKKFFVHELYVDSFTFQVCSIIQEFLEAIINSSIEPKLEFFTYGNVEFVNQMSDILGFLNVNASSIKINRK